MFVDDMPGRQLWDDPRDEQDPGDGDSQVIDLTQPQEEVGNRVDRRYDVEGKQRRKSEFSCRNALVSKEPPTQPQLIAKTTIEKRGRAGKCGSCSSFHRLSLLAIDVHGRSALIRLENVNHWRHVPPGRWPVQRRAWPQECSH